MLFIFDFAKFQFSNFLISLFFVFNNTQVYPKISAKLFRYEFQILFSKTNALRNLLLPYIDDWSCDLSFRYISFCNYLWIKNSSTCRQLKDIITCQSVNMHSITRSKTTMSLYFGSIQWPVLHLTHSGAGEGGRGEVKGLDCVVLQRQRRLHPISYDKQV